MGHMRISIIIAIANTFTMSLPSSVDIEVIIPLGVYSVKGQLYFCRLAQNEVLPFVI